MSPARPARPRLGTHADGARQAHRRARRAQDKICRNLCFYYKDIPGGRRHQHRASTTPGDRLHRSVGLRQVDSAAHAQPHLRALSRPARHRRSPARRPGHPRAGQDLNLLRAKVGMVFQKPTPFPMSIYDNIAFGIRLYEKLSAQRARGARRTGAAPRGAVGRGQGQAPAERPRPLGRPAAAALHRPRRSRSSPRSCCSTSRLGARSDLDAEDRGADRRAQVGLLHRDRHAQHAAGGAQLGLHRLHVSRRAHRVRRDRDDLHPSDEKQTEDYITGRFG